MKNTGIVTTLFCFCTLLWLSCGDKAAENGNGQMDLSVVGYWEGAMEPIPFVGFKGAQIFNRITAVDSAFTLVTLDTSRGIDRPIRDTTLYLAGKWRLNVPGDSILLLPDTCRIIDTAQNILVPREVRGQTIPMLINISTYQPTGEIEWTVAIADLMPLAPLLGLNLSGIPPGLLQAVQIILVKRWQ